MSMIDAITKQISEMRFTIEVEHTSSYSSLIGQPQYPFHNLASADWLSSRENFELHNKFTNPLKLFRTHKTLGRCIPPYLVLLF